MLVFDGGSTDQGFSQPWDPANIPSQAFLQALEASTDGSGQQFIGPGGTVISVREYEALLARGLIDPSRPILLQGSIISGGQAPASWRSPAHSSGIPPSIPGTVSPIGGSPIPSASSPAAVSSSWGLVAVLVLAGWLILR